jgi:hypothetical protein
MDNFHVLFNQQRYYFKITLYNEVKDPVELELKHIENLSIDESLFKWYTTATLTLKTGFEFFERGLPVQTDSVEKISELYTFRNDGRNKVNIQIYPIQEDETGKPSFENLDPEIWNINYDFVIYDVEDIYAHEYSKKKKILYLWDERYQYFLERNIQWSSYYVAATELKTNKLLKDSSCLVGKAIKHIIQTACGENDYNNIADKLKVGWKGDDGSIDKPNLNVATFNDDLWDDGAENNKILYTSPSNFSVAEDIDYLMQYYVSTNNTEDTKKFGLFGILRFHRYLKDWRLTSIKELYKDSTDGDKPGKAFIETFYIETPENPEHLLDGVSRSPIGPSAGPSSTITSYRFVNMSPSDDLYISNRLAVQFDNTAGIWKIFLKDSSLKDTHKFLKKEILPQLFSSKGLLLNVRPDKSNGLITLPEHIVSQSPAARVFWRNILAYQSIFLNHALEFDCKGLTLRTPGKFIGIDRDQNKSPLKNDFDDKLLGQWLLAKVTHIFSEDNYTTNCVGVKINSYNEIESFDPDK